MYKSDPKHSELMIEFRRQMDAKPVLAPGLQEEVSKRGRQVRKEETTAQTDDDEEVNEEGSPVLCFGSQSELIGTGPGQACNSPHCNPARN